MIMSRSNIKTFDDFKGDKYVEDIEGILVELKDKGFKIYVKYIKNSIGVGIGRIDNKEFFDISDIYEYVKTIESYLRIYLKKYQIFFVVTYDDFKNTTIDSLDTIPGCTDYYKHNLRYIQIIISGI